MPKKTILVVHDDPASVEMLVDRLEESYEVLTARDGVKAAYLYERHLDRIAALIIKFKIPRLDGSALTDWVHHINPKLPVILLNNRISKLRTTQQRPVAATHFMTTPFAPVRIEAMLRDVL